MLIKLTPKEERRRWIFIFSLLISGTVKVDHRLCSVAMLVNFSTVLFSPSIFYSLLQGGALGDLEHFIFVNKDDEKTKGIKLLHYNNYNKRNFTHPSKNGSNVPFLQKGIFVHQRWSLTCLSPYGQMICTINLALLAYCVPLIYVCRTYVDLCTCI